MSSNQEKKIKSLNLRLQKETQNVADLKATVKQCMTATSQVINSMQSWETVIKQSMQITHNMAVAMNVLMDKGLITKEELEEKHKTMAEQQLKAKQDLESQKTEVPLGNMASHVQEMQDEDEAKETPDVNSNEYS